MSMLQRVRNLWRRERVDVEIEEELRSHLEMAAEDAEQAGMSPEEARRTARLRFGNLQSIQERAHEADVALMLEGLLRDVQYALRQMRKAPGYSAVVIATLALGIGANTTVFSIVDAVMLRPLPYAHPQRLVEVEASERSDYYLSDVSYPDFFDWRAQNHSFEHLVSYHDASFTLTGLQSPVHLGGEVVSWDLLPVLGISPELGRGFLPQEEKQGTRVVLISHALWVSQFASDLSVIGRTITLSGEPFTVVGVMPASFRFPAQVPHNAAWVTLSVDDDPADHNPAVNNRGMHWLNVIGRLKPGVTVAQADDEMKTIAARLAKQYPDTNARHSSARVVQELTAVLGDTRPLLLLVMGAVGLVLLIACGNIANLLLARMRDRQREMAMRSALGAAKGRIVRQLLAESLTLGIAGGTAGCTLAFITTPLALRLIPGGVPRAADAGVDGLVLGFALLVSLLSAMLFGLLPAMVAAKTDLVSTLKESGRADVAGGDRVRAAVIVGQVALGIVLTAGAGLLMTSFVRLAHRSEGFDPHHVLTFTFETPDTRYKNTRPQFYQRYFEKLRGLPGAELAAGSMFLPMTDNNAKLGFENPERPVTAGQRPIALVDIVSRDYFRTMQIPLLAGRDFAEGDDGNAPQVMIVNDAFARTYFSGENPLGKKLKPGAGTGAPGGPAWREIVGVVGDTRQSATQLEMKPEMYLPASQLPNWCCMYSVVRSAVDPLSLAPAARRVVASMDRDIPVTDVRTMGDLLALQLAQPRFALVLLGTFAGLALLLTVVGLYGVMMYSVSRRTKEIGVRLALGAKRRTVEAMVLREAAALLAPGMAIGLAVTLASAPVLRSMLYGVSGRDPAVLALVCGVVALAGLLSAWLPAMRASGIDPMQALRRE